MSGRGELSVRPVCIDASFAIRSVLPGPARDKAQALWTRWIAGERRILAPQLWVLEITNGLWKLTWGASPLVDKPTAREALEYLLLLPVELYNLERRALQLWDEVLNKMGITTAYDAAYLLTAMLNQADLWTCDRRLFAEAEDSGLARAIHLLE